MVMENCNGKLVNLSSFSSMGPSQSLKQVLASNVSTRSTHNVKIRDIHLCKQHSKVLTMSKATIHSFLTLMTDCSTVVISLVLSNQMQCSVRYGLKNQLFYWCFLINTLYGLYSAVPINCEIYTTLGKSWKLMKWGGTDTY